MKSNNNNIKKLWLGYGLTGLSFVGLILPTVILFAVNYNDWVVQGETTKISLGAMLGMVYAIFVMNGALKELNPKLATLISMVVVLFIVWFLESVIQDLFWVILSVIGGYVIYMSISAIGANQLLEYKIYKDEKIRAKVRKQAQDEIIGV